MCGIAGLFLPRGAREAEADLGAMLSVMRHRGPDGTGRYISGDRRYQAAFRRLAIIDLETGDQPIVEDGGERVLMGNGEIYNYVELRKEEPNYPYRTTGDMEVVLPLARTGGFVHRLNGMYALALYERDPHRLLLVRDRLGVKPLYWARTSGDGILFASEVKALFASGLLTPECDDDAVSSYLTHGYVPAPMTLYKGVHKLPPGHTLSVTADGAVSVDRYWRAAMATDLPADPGAIEDRLIELLRDSVRLQLRSDVPVGALLSGGIDSGLMVALAAEQAEGRLATFTVRFEGPAADESPLAAQVAERYDTDHTVLTLEAGTVARHLPRLAWHSEEPLFDPALLPNDLIEAALSEHRKVALNGTGGDELFAGYGRYFQLPVERGYLALPGWLRRGAVEPAIRMVSPMTAWKLARAEKFHRDPGGYLNDHTSLFPAPMRALMGHRAPEPEPAQTAYCRAFQGPAQTTKLIGDLCTYLPEDPLALLDRTSMAHGVEGRVPLLDHRVVEAALAVPPAIRAPEGKQKALERRIAERFLPEDVVSAPKRGFASPVPAWMQAGLGPVARRILTRPRTLERGWWTKDGIERLLERPQEHGFRIYSLLMLELAVRLHVEGAAASAPPTDGLEAFADAA